MSLLTNLLDGISPFDRFLLPPLVLSAFISPTTHVMRERVHVPNTRWIVQGFHQFYCDEKGRCDGWVTVKECKYQDLCQNIATPHHHIATPDLT